MWDTYLKQRMKSALNPICQYVDVRLLKQLANACPSVLKGRCWVQHACVPDFRVLPMSMPKNCQVYSQIQIDKHLKSMWSGHVYKMFTSESCIRHTCTVRVTHIGFEKQLLNSHFSTKTSCGEQLWLFKVCPFSKWFPKTSEVTTCKLFLFRWSVQKPSVRIVSQQLWPPALNNHWTHRSWNLPNLLCRHHDPPVGPKGNPLHRNPLPMASP